MPNLVSQSLKILNGAVKEVGKDYFANLTTFYNDAKNVKNTMLNASTDVADTYAKIKKTNVTKAIHDWFYQEETNSDSEMNTDEFDAGFEVASSKDNKLDGESEPTALTADSMTSITNKQTNTLLKIGRRQNEQSVANTAEIISTIDTRTSEMLTSLNNINKTLLGISSRLDKIIDLQGIEVQKSSEIDKGGLYQDGNLSLGRIFEAAKQNVLTTGPMSFLTTGLDMFKSGMATPTALAAFGLKGLAGKIKVNGKSFDDWGMAFNEIVGTATQTAMNEMINSSFFKKFIGNITGFTEDKDYHSVVPDLYDTKKAQFDGMTRYSIVNIIPEMLAKINKSISGQEYHLDNRGRWIAGPMKNEFNEVTRASFANTGITSTSAMNRIANAGVQSIGKKIPQKDIELASKALTMAIVMDQHYRGQRSFTISQLKGDISGYVANAVQVLVMTGNSDPAYWANVCQCIAIQLSSGLMDASGFVRNINDSLQNMIKQATEFAQTGKPNAVQAGRLSFKIAAGQFLSEYAPKADKEAIIAKNNGGTLVDGRNITVDPKNKLGKYSINQYIGGIFYLLNRGINVHVTGKKAYDQFRLEDVRPDSIPYETDNAFGEAIKDALTGGGSMKSAVKNAVKEELGVNDKEKGVIGKLLSDPSMLFNSLTHLFSGGTINADGIKDKARGLLGEERYNAIADKFGNVKDRITHDDRYITAKLAAEEAVEKIKNKGREIGDKIGHTRIGNNIVYGKDSFVLRNSQDAIRHWQLSEDDEATDGMWLRVIKSKMDKPTSESIVTMKDAARHIQNKTLRAEVDKMLNVLSKREGGRVDTAVGNTPDIGAILMEKDIKPVSGKGEDTEKGILRKILGVVGKIGKLVGKLETRGMSNVLYGLKSIGQGLFGYEDFDPYKNKVYKNKGFIRNISTEMAKSLNRSVRDVARATANAVTAKFGNPNDQRSLRQRYEDEIDLKSGARMPGFRVDRDGNLIAEDDKKWDWLNKTAVNKYTRYGEPANYYERANVKVEKDMTIADALKHPLEATGKIIKNFGQNVASSGKWLKNTFIGAFKELYEEIGKGLEKLRGAGSKVKSKVMGSKVGQFLFNNKIVRGFTSGFSEAKQARAEKAAKKSYEKDKAEHPLEGVIVDYLSYSDSSNNNQLTGKPSFLQKIFEKLFGSNGEGSDENSILGIIKANRQDEQDRIAEEEQAEREAEAEAKKSESENIDDAQDEAKKKVKNASDGNTLTPTVDSSTAGGSWSTSGVTTASSMVNIGAVNTTTSAGAASYISGNTGAEVVSGGGILNNIGNTVGSMAKMFGGFMQLFVGLFEMIAGAVMALEGLQALKDLVKSIITEGIKPLNEIFTSIIDLIKPAVKMLTKIVQVISKTIATIAKSIIKTIQPIIEAIQPIFEAIFKILEPILMVITTILDVVLMPIKMILDACKPLFESMAYKMQMLTGVVEWLCGGLLAGFSELLEGVGIICGLLDKITGKGDETNTILEVGQKIGQGADELMAQGKQDIAEGFAGSYGKILEFFTGKEYNPKAKEVVAEAYGTPAKLGTDFGAGDVNTSYTTNNYYGSGNPMDQHSYGKYMNMSERGCGPIALADAYGRRSGNNINPGLMAGLMAGAGAYDPSRGTSVNSMVSVGNALGMGIRAGGVTAASIKQATPDRPITLLGSGSGYGTRSGHNHYVNVVGTDGSGNAFVSNPMSGKIERHNAGLLVSNAKLGLYGSGDYDDEDENDLSEYGFSDEAYDALTRLKAITSKFTSMFQGGDNAEEDEKNKSAVNTMKYTLSEDKYNEVSDKAKSKLMELYPREEGEDEQSYLAKIDKKLNSARGRKLMVSYGSQYMQDYVSEKQSGLTGAFEKAQSVMKESNSALANAISSLIASNNMSADAVTGAEMARFEPILHLEPKLTEGSNGVYISSPVHDFFNATSIEGNLATRSNGAKGTVYSSSRGGWFGKYGGKQTDEGVGSSGEAHEGILLRYTNDGKIQGNAMARAITGGTITYVTKDDKSGLGNSVKWRDSGGMYHWYMHMASLDKAMQEGANIEPGQLIGYFGRSGLDEEDENGNKLGNVLRYVVTSAGPQGSTGDPGYINPFTYWQFRAQSDDLIGNTQKEQIYNYLVNHFGMSEAGAAGVMGVLSCEGMLEPEPYSAQMEGYFGEGKDAKSKQYDTLQKMNDYTVNSLFPGYDRGGVNYSKNGYLSDGLYLPGIGLAQWTGGRARGLHDFAKSKGMNWYDLQAQLDFMEAEKSGTFSSLMSLLTSKTITPKQAADAWMTQYEAGCSGTDPYQSWLGSAQITKRENNAEALYKELYGHVTNAAAKTNDDGVYTGKFIASATNPNAFSDDGYFSSAGGAALADYGKPSITAVNIDSATSGNSPLHEFFSKTAGGKAMSGNGNWYSQRNSPNKQGVGSSGGSHSGIDFWWDSNTEGRELHATTGGVVDAMQGGSGYNGGCGNNIRWLDDAGYLHWFMHMKDTPKLSKGDKVAPGQLLGYVGNTGDSDGAHLHYSIIEGSQFNGFSGSPGGVNPLMYFSNYDSAGPQTNPNERGGLSFKTKRNSDSSKAVKATQDVGDTITNAFANLGGSGDISTVDVPPLDMGKLTDNPAYSGLLGLNQYINKYSVKTDDQATTNMLNKLGSMTFNVRAQRVEELLEILIAKVDGGSAPANAPLPNLFNEGIPEPVTRLSIG